MLPSDRNTSDQGTSRPDAITVVMGISPAGVVMGEFVIVVVADEVVFAGVEGAVVVVAMVVVPSGVVVGDITVGVEMMAD
jgi:hypothetical protein